MMDQKITNLSCSLTKEEIKNLWAINRIEAATLGTNLHKYIEDKYNQVEFSEKQKKNFRQV